MTDNKLNVYDLFYKLNGATMVYKVAARDEKTAKLMFEKEIVDSPLAQNEEIEFKGFTLLERSVRICREDL